MFTSNNMNKFDIGLIGNDSLNILKILFQAYSSTFNSTEKDPGFESYLRSWIERFISCIYRKIPTVLQLDLFIAIHCIRCKSIWASNLIRCSLTNLWKIDPKIALEHVFALLNIILYENDHQQKLNYTNTT